MESTGEGDVERCRRYGIKQLLLRDFRWEGTASINSKGFLFEIEKVCIGTGVADVGTSLERGVSR